MFPGYALLYIFSVFCFGCPKESAMLIHYLSQLTDWFSFYFNIRRFARFLFGCVFSSNLFCFKVCPYWWNKDFVKCSLPPLWPRCLPGSRCLQRQGTIGRYTPRSLADRPSKYFNSKRCLPTHIPFHFAPKSYYVVSYRIRLERFNYKYTVRL